MATCNASAARTAILACSLLTLAATAGRAQGDAPPAAPPARARGALGIDTSAMDRSVSPRDDFYAFANGTWIRTAPIPPGMSQYNAFYEVTDRIELDLRGLLEHAADAAARPGGSSNQQRLGAFYRSFMDTAGVEAAGLRPLADELARVAAVREHAALPELFVHLLRIGVRTPISLEVAQDRRRAERSAVYVGQSGLGLPGADYYARSGEQFARSRDAYQTYAETLLRLAGEPDAGTAAAHVVNLETVLAARHWSRARTRDPHATYNPRTVAELERSAPNLGWRRVLRAAGVAHAPSVILEEPSFVAGLDTVLRRTPIAVWRHYLTVRILDAYAPYLSRPFVDARAALRRDVYGVARPSPRWKRGIIAVNDLLGLALSELYVARHVRPEAKARVQTLVREVGAAFDAGIGELAWMSPATKAAARAKLARMQVAIGYPDAWQSYAGLSVRPDDLVGNVRRARAFAFADMAAQLGTHADRTRWPDLPHQVDGGYVPWDNRISFTAGLLQPPFFDPTADDAANYGAIGAAIGHEISHAFDDEGSKYDGGGNLRNWWTPVDARRFRERAARLVAQYGALEPLPGLRVDGQQTLGENIADLSGVTVAYRAYRRSLAGKEAPEIAGLTGDQRFFLGWAQMWRSRMHENTLRAHVVTDTHAPEQYRTNAVLRNLPAFHRAFGVRPGDRMYLPPAEQVQIW